eukprot:357165-Chlamydomonas_euryale.AAC.1
MWLGACQGRGDSCQWLAERGSERGWWFDEGRRDNGWWPAFGFIGLAPECVCLQHFGCECAAWASEDVILPTSPPWPSPATEQIHPSPDGAAVPPRSADPSYGRLALLPTPTHKENLTRALQLQPWLRSLFAPPTLPM